MNKDEVARKLIDWHFEVDPHTTEIYRFITDGEQQPDEPIKLLEVNASTLETGRVDAFGFGPADDITFPSVVAQVTPHELDRIRTGEMLLPKGWNLATALHFENVKNGHAHP